jgi:glycosyltransferase involved in cell wall biosynthesis
MITIAVCIPTYRRPDFLRQAVYSCLQQDLLPNEILIGDDSSDDTTEAVVDELHRKSRVPIHYWRNRPGRGQGENINGLYGKVLSSHLVLLHDDDLLLPNALSDLSACWDRYPDLTAAYGKQYVILEDGTICSRKSDELNRTFFRTLEYEGLQEFSWFPGLVQQFPNDCFMVTTHAAQTTLWRSPKNVGNGGEFDFGLRLCLRYRRFYFLNQYTAKYRLTTVSNSNSRNDEVLWAYRILKRTNVPAEAEIVRRKKLEILAPQAIIEASYLGHRSEALEIYWGDFYPWRLRITLGGFRRLGHCILPGGVVKLVRDRVIRSRARKRDFEDLER